MGEIYLLDDGTSSIGISPIRGQNEPEERGREILRGKDGKEDAHEWGGKDVFETPFNAVSKTEADLLIDWWENMTTITFTKDLQGAPGTTLEVKIAEVTRPMQMWGGDWDTLFAGMLTLYQISSVSFSSSSGSVSGSTSCSSLSDSSSCSTGSSKSCSVFLISVSQSSSIGIESVSSCSTSQGSSCSTSLSVSCSVTSQISCSSFSVGQSCSESTAQSCSSDTSRSCSISTSRSCSESLSSSVGIIGVSFVSQSCSLDPVGDISCSLSEGGQSCSESGAG